MMKTKNHKINVTFASSIILFIFTSVSYADVGDVYIFSEPGIGIYVNGEYKGLSSLKNIGILLKGLKAGPIIVKAVKVGHRPYIFKVNIKRVLPEFVGPHAAPFARESSA